VGEPIIPYTWDHFDDGHRPPTAFELAVDICDEFHEAELISVHHKICSMNHSQQESVTIYMHIGAHTNPGEINGESYDFIGMQGPAKVMFRTVSISNYSSNMYSQAATLEGQVYYD